MEVKPVVAVVTQKLADTLDEKSIADNKVVLHQLKGVRKSLMKLQTFSSRAHLGAIYQLEDEIEKFTFQVALQRKRFGCLMKHTFFFNNLNSCRRLKQKIKKIRTTISTSPESEDSTPSPSSNNTLSLSSVNNGDLDHDGDDYYDGDYFNHDTNERPQKSSSAVWPISEIPTTPSPKRALVRSFSTIPHHQEHMQQRKRLNFSYYNDLRIHSKLCLLYLALFPIDYDIPVRRLLRLWLAEGFVKRGSKDRFPEDLVQKCFDEMVGRNMIQITKLRSDNSPRRCRLVPFFHNYLLPKAQDISLFYIHRNSEHFEDAAGPFGVRRLVQHTNNTEAVGSQQSQGQVRVDPSLLRSYVSFNFQPKDMLERQVGMVLGRVIRSNFALLRVLDLEGVCQTSLPDKLGQLRHLRYLGLRWTFLESLPESVGDLSYLETLDVKHTNVDTIPDSIWRLKRLRHLNLNNIRLSMPPKSSSSLVTLWGLVLDEKISISEGLGKLLNLRELGIKFSLDKSQNVLLDWIVKLVNLQSLRLISVDDMGQPSNLVLKPLTTLNHLSHLNLYGQLEKLPAVDEFPPTVKVLTLSISKLDKDPMETLEQLPCLIVLRLLGDSFTGTRMVCHRGGFKKLEVLKLWVLKNLEEWDVEEEAMERLKEVEIRSCHKLSNIPSRILQKQRCLEELISTDMPAEFVAGIKKRKSKYTSLTVK